MEVVRQLLSILFIAAALSLYAQKHDKEAVGKIERSTLTEDPEYKKWFVQGYNEYQPVDSLVIRLRPLLRNKKIVVVLGTWCSDSQLDVPHLINLLDEVEFERTELELWAIDRKKTEPANIISKYNIEFVPTIMVFDKEGKEVARIIEQPEVSLEADLIKLLLKE